MAAKMSETRGLRVLRNNWGAVALLWTGAALCWGCGGGQAKVEASASASVDFDKDGTRAVPSSTTSKTQAADADAPAPGTQGGPALLGARHDVRVKTPSSTLACQCLSAVAGDPKHPELLWSGESPTIDPSSQIVIAIDSEGAPCSSSNAPDVSYMGYTVEGSDTVIELEVAQEGRPLTRGAIVPRPNGGQLRIRAPKALPYGKATSGSGACTIPLR